MKLKCYRASSGSIRDPVQPAHHSPAPVGPIQTKGGCILRPVPLMTTPQLQSALAPPFLSLQWEISADAVSTALPLASFWTGQRSGSLQRPSLMRLSEDVVSQLTSLSPVQVCVTGNHAIFYYLFRKQKEIQCNIPIILQFGNFSNLTLGCSI